MASLGTTKTWIPYMNSKECSQEVCGLYCPHWCYMIFSPPPPYEFPEDSSGSSFSPLAIAIIGILASAFLLVSYYTIISKYCGNRDPSGRGENQIQNVELGEEDHDPSLHEPWHMSTTGLDEALIKSITVCKYKKGDGLIEGTDCSVCLSEFEEDQNVRLLPKCSHAFHVPCIDNWLKSHSSCPLCRANIFFASAPMPQSPRLAPQALMEHPQGNNGNSQTANENVAVPAQNMERVAAEEEMEHNDGLPKTPLRAFSDLGSLQQRDTVIEIRDEGSLNIRRSVSMDHHSFQICAALSSTIPSVAGVWAMNQDELVREEESCSGGFSSSKCSSGAGVPMCKSGHKRKVVQHRVPCPVAMKRSFSSGRFFLSRHARLRDSITPV